MGPGLQSRVRWAADLARNVQSKAVDNMYAVVTADDRRGDERIAVGMRAVLTYREGSVLWTEADAGIADLSRGGMYVLCDRCPAGDQRVILQFSSRRGMCRAIGFPVRFSSRGGFGVRFEYVSDELLGLLRDLRLLSHLGQAREMSVIIDAAINVC